MEQDPSVFKLEQRVKDYHAGKESEESKRAREELNDQDVFNAPQTTVTQFWCEECQQERVARAYKVIQTDWTNPSRHIAFYEAKSCHRLRRRITDKYSDPYFNQSHQLRKQRIDLAKDLIQPGQWGFDTLYK